MAPAGTSNVEPGTSVVYAVIVRPPPVDACTSVTTPALLAHHVPAELPPLEMLTHCDAWPAIVFDDCVTEMPAMRLATRPAKVSSTEMTDLGSNRAVSDANGELPDVATQVVEPDDVEQNSVCVPVSMTDPSGVVNRDFGGAWATVQFCDEPPVVCRYVAR